MSTAAIIRRIQEDSSCEIARILKRAEEECTEILHAGTRIADQEYERILTAGERAVHQEMGEMQSQMRIEARNRVRRCREDLVARSFEEAVLLLEDIRSHPDYPVLFSRLCEEGRLILDTDTICITIDPRDRHLADITAADYLKRGISMTFAECEYPTSGGIIIHRSDGAYVDNTLNARLEREKRDLLIEIAEILFDQGSLV